MMRPELVCCFKLLLLLTLGGVTMHVPDADVLAPLGALRLDGHFSFHDVSAVARDFGNRCSQLPAAVLHPGSVSDVAAAVRRVFQLGERSPLTVAARGHGHSLLGQSQAAGGIVVRMESLGGGASRMVVRGEDGTSPYVDAPGGELWINVLHETLKHGLAPKSWTDYLHLTVGGTLSNAGVSGQAFRHGPQVSNVNQPRRTLTSSMLLLAALVSLGSSPELGLLLSLEFLDRVHSSELKLRAQGLWEVPHPWLNLLIPRSAIHRFAREVFGKILKDSNNGPILLYPVNKSK